MIRVPLDQLQARFLRVILDAGIPEPGATRCARHFAENTRDGVASHGIHRFPAFIESVRTGIVDPHAQARPVASLGPIEQWDGHRGIGLLNAEAAMARAVQLAATHTLGCVGLRNTNHWMRAGSYGLQAAHAGCIGICWTNTRALMPAWGARESKLGNNPMMICLPRPGGPILLDIAMSQYAMGKLKVLADRGETLPTPGGFDHTGQPTTDPAAILAGGRALPTGHWKGSGLALVLDLLAAMISGGDTTHQITARGGETGVSQVFIAIDTARLDVEPRKIEQALTDFVAAAPIDAARPVRYPGQGMLATRRDSEAHGVAVDRPSWEKLCSL